MKRAFFNTLALICLLSISTDARAEDIATTPPVPMKPAAALLRKQDPPIIYKVPAAAITPENSHIRISLATQRAALMVRDEIYIDTPVSTGKRGAPTPTGTFIIQEKERDHRSSLYGEFVDNKGRTVRSGVSMRADSAPSGTHYVSSPMRWFCRLKGTIGIHVGILPGYPASHGSVRLPDTIGPLFYEKVKVGTRVEIVAE